METITFDKKEVEVVGVSFSHNGSELRFNSYPRKLVYKGREYSLVEA